LIWIFCQLSTSRNNVHTKTSIAEAPGSHSINVAANAPSDRTSIQCFAVSLTCARGSVTVCVPLLNSYAAALAVDENLCKLPAMMQFKTAAVLTLAVALFNAVGYLAGW
jgi:hypothetical protein